MTMQWGDRVQETFTTTGTGTISLGGAVTGYQAFSSVCSNTDTTYYAATDGTNWEVGLGTYSTSGNTLARTTILASSNSGSAVSWGAGTKNIWQDVPAVAFKAPKIQSFTSSGTYTPTTGMTSCTVEMVGAGGGGGGVGTTSFSAAAGGGAGGYIRASLTAAQVGSSQTVTIGAAGTAGPNTGGSGGTGGATSLGSLLSCNGGAGGGFAAANAANGGGGGSATITTGTGVSISGSNGGMSSGTSSGMIAAGSGASSPFGGGGSYWFSFNTGGATQGQAGTGYGSGGGGAYNFGSGGAAETGATGQGGLMIITEYFS